MKSLIEPGSGSMLFGKKGSLWKRSMPSREAPILREKIICDGNSISMNENKRLPRDWPICERIEWIDILMWIGQKPSLPVRLIDNGWNRGGKALQEPIGWVVFEIYKM